jgi:hypothetical protein
MSNEYPDPSGNTEQFKAFVQAPPDSAGRSRAPLVIGGVVAVVLVVIVLFLAVG